MCTSKKPNLQTLLWLTVPCLTVNLVILLTLLFYRPTYLHDYRLNIWPDANDFVTLGRNIVEQHAFSREPEPPYSSCAVRTPGYPLMVGISFALCGTIGIYIFNILCHLLTVLASYYIVDQIFTRRTAIITGVLIGSDFMWAVMNFTAMSESLYSLIATIGILWWIKAVIYQQRTKASDLVLCGLCLGGAALVRPTAIYLPVVATISSTLVSLFMRKRYYATRTVIIAAISIATFSPWIMRNYLLFGVAKISTTDASNLIYAAGASAHAMHLDISIDEARNRIQQEFNLVSQVETNNHWLANRPVKQLYEEQRDAVRPVLSRYPIALVKSSITGVLKAAISHNAGILSESCGLPWEGPKLSRLMRLDWSGVGNMFRRNPPIFSIVCIWEFAFSISVLLFGFLGIIKGMTHSKSRIPCFFLAAITGYYCLTIAVVGSEAFFRHRHMLIPIWCLFASLSVTSLYQSLKGLQLTNSKVFTSSHTDA